MITWQDVWSWIPNMIPAQREPLIERAVKNIKTLSYDAQIKALEGAPEEVLKHFRTDESILPEDWEEASKRWSEIK